MGNTPNIRFKGFTDDWEQRKLGEVATFLNGRAYKQNELLEFGKYRVLRVGNFYTNDSWYYSNLELDDKYYIDKGDLVYTWSATFGPHIWGGEKVIYHYHIWKIELSEYLEKLFSLHLLEADKARLLSSTNGSTMIHVTKGDMEGKTITLPSIEEQKKIGSFLTQLDNLITLHQRKLSDVQKLKSGLLQKMFPKNGEKVPEIRFPEFSNDWEQRKLGDIADVIDPHPSHRAPVATDVGIPFIGIGDVDEVGNINRVKARIVDRKIYDEQHKRYDLSTPSIGIGRVASLGKVIRLRNDIGEYAVSPTMSVIQFSDINNLDFLYANMNTPIFQNQFKSFSNGSTRQSVGIQDLRNLLLFVPNKLEEQEKIGSFFTQLDNLITLHQRKLEHLQQQKKALLQQMFI